MGRIAAIDFGLKRIGIAISDERKKIAFPMETIPGGAKAVDEIKRLLTPKGVELILVGLPLMLSGQEGEMAGKVREFGKALEIAMNVPVKFVDERFSSKIVDRSLKEICLNRKERTAKVDEGAAALLLQSYIDYGC